MPVTHTWMNFSLAASLVLVCASCRVAEPVPMHVSRQHKILHQWYDDGGPGKVTIKISLPDQIAEFQRGGRDIGWCYVATGREGYGTKPGTYKITEKIVDKYSNRYGWIEDEFGNVVEGSARYNAPVEEGMTYVPAPMPYWMRLTSYGIGMHGGLIPEPGKPASHGCIRLPKEIVETIYNSVEVGTTVVITNEPVQQPPPPEETLPPLPPLPPMPQYATAVGPPGSVRY